MLVVLLSRHTPHNKPPTTSVNHFRQKNDALVCACVCGSVNEVGVECVCASECVRSLGSLEEAFGVPCLPLRRPSAIRSGIMLAISALPSSPTSSRLSSICMTASDRRAVLLSSLALCSTVLPRAAHSEESEQPAPLQPAPVQPAPVQPAPLQRLTSAYDFDVPFRGEPADIKPFLGKANIFVNVKFDDPESTQQMPGLQDLVSKYASEGLHVLAFPTDQGWFEADDSNTLRIKFKQVYNFGQYPTAVVRRLPF